MIAGAAIQTAASVGQHVLSKTLTDKYMRKANNDLFGPRNLAARLCTTHALRQLLGLDPEGTPEPTKLVKAARQAGDIITRLPIPFAKGAVLALSPQSTRAPVDPNAGDGATARRLAALQGHIAQLEFDVPPPTPPENLMDTLSGWAVSVRRWQDDRTQKKAQLRRRLLDNSGPGPITSDRTQWRLDLKKGTHSLFASGPLVPELRNRHLLQSFWAFLPGSWVSTPTADKRRAEISGVSREGPASKTSASAKTSRSASFLARSSSTITKNIARPKRFSG
jgi:hypothetical protein